MDRYTLITGASSGLGKEFAKLYAKDGNNLVLVASNEEKLNAVAEEVKKEYTNVDVKVCVADLSSVENMKKVKAFCEGIFINNLVNCAGFGDRCDFKDMDIDFQIKMTEVNCNAVLYFTRVFLDDMLKNDEGHIINVSSIASFYPGPYMCTYHATKSFVTTFGESVSYELRDTKVKLLTLCPGPFTSGFTSVAHNDYTFEKIKPISAAAVARFGYEKSLKGKRLATVGFGNRLTAFASRFLPRKAIISASAKQLKKL